MTERTRFVEGWAAEVLSKNHFRSIGAASVVGGAVLSVLAFPLVASGDRNLIFGSAICLSVGVAILVGEYHRGINKVWAVLAFTFAVAGVGGLLWAANGALNNAMLNDRRCFAIQHDMLSAQPRRNDGPDLFQALGCRPQGVGSVFARPTRLERRANHKLPNGGRS